MTAKSSLSKRRQGAFPWPNRAYGIGGRVPAGLIGAVLLVAVSGVVPAHADTVDVLKSAIDAVHREGGCAPLQWEPRLAELTERTVHEVQGWVTHTATSLPVEDTTLMSELRRLDYRTLKARMLSGYADDLTGGAGSYQDKAIKATILQGRSFDVLGDCSYTKFGTSALSDDGSQGWPSTPPKSFAVTSVVLASD